MSNGVIRVRPETRAKIDQIARNHRWGIGQTVDAIADAFLALTQDEKQKVMERIKPKVAA